MKTSDFKNLEVWQRSMTLCREIYLLVKKLPREETYSLSDQMRRAVISIPSNIAEGHGRESKREFLQFLSIAKGSLCELETQCLVAVETDLLEREDITVALSLCAEVGRMIKSLHTYTSEQLKRRNQ